jgi:hypothetical protein
MAPPLPESVRGPLRLLLADRGAPEAQALFLTLAGYVDRRVRRQTQARYRDLLGAAEQDEVVAEVLYQLMAGSLAQFRGDSLPELLGFVRSVSDRCLGRAARKRLRERQALDLEGQEEVRSWSGTLPRPDQVVHLVPESPLAAQDEDYLRALLRAGSRADFARATGVSRAAVTQRVQRIKARIEGLSPLEQQAAEGWLHHEARLAATQQ